MASENDASANHSETVRQVLQSAQRTWEACLNLEAADDINPDGVFVPAQDYGDMHPQKAAHTHLLGYHQLIANKAYTVRAQDLWTEEVTDEAGHAIEVAVPATDHIYLDAGESLAIGNVPTETETITLETLHHKWSQRAVTVESRERGSWGDQLGETTTRRVWLSPRAIVAAFDQLEDVRAKIGFGADLPTPDWRAQKVLDPNEGVREPKQ